MTRNAVLPKLGSSLSCRACGADSLELVLDLGLSPMANSYVPEEAVGRGEMCYPLQAYYCGGCHLVQLAQFESPQAIFSDYAYFSSYSTSWLEHARRYVEQVTERFHLNRESFVVEVASNDGYLLQHFVAKKIPVLGVEPAKNVAAEAEKKGIPTLSEFFGKALGERLAKKGRADLIVANNVLAHVPDIRDFVSGFAALLAPGGVLTVEFPHLAKLVEGNQFDTIYHEHFSYLSLVSVERLFEELGLEVFDVEEVSTHGGSLRVFAQLQKTGKQPKSVKVQKILQQEKEMRLDGVEGYRSLQAMALEAKLSLVDFLLKARREGKKVAAYGAPAKGNTLLNYCGIRSDLISYTVDKNPVKQGRYLPGSRIPIRGPEALLRDRPDYILVLPWNLLDEIKKQLSTVSQWGGRFVVAIPTTKIV